MKDGLKIDIGRRLARIRNHLGFNQKRMADRLGMAYISYNRIERDVEEMVYLMRHIPLVRYSMMDHFQRFKLDNRTVLDEELKKIAGT